MGCRGSEVQILSLRSFLEARLQRWLRATTGDVRRECRGSFWTVDCQSREVVSFPKPLHHLTLPMNTKQAMARLEELGDEKRRAFNAKRGAGDNQFGVKTGDIRKLAKAIKVDHELGRSLWKTGNADAQMLAILLVRPEELSAKELSTMAKEGACEWVADWLSSYVIKNHPDKESVREKWMKSKDAMTARAGWSLTA